MEAGTVGRRLGDQDTRYGDVPPRPDPAIRPSARFPRSADEPTPDVVPKPTPPKDETDDEDEYERGISLLDDRDPVHDEEPPLTGTRPPDEPLEFEATTSRSRLDLSDDDPDAADDDDEADDASRGARRGRRGRRLGGHRGRAAALERAADR